MSQIAAARFGVPEGAVEVRQEAGSRRIRAVLIDPKPSGPSETEDRTFLALRYAVDTHGVLYELPSAAKVEKGSTPQTTEEAAESTEARKTSVALAISLCALPCVMALAATWFVDLNTDKFFWLGSDPTPGEVGASGFVVFALALGVPAAGDILKATKSEPVRKELDAWKSLISLAVAVVALTLAAAWQEIAPEIVIPTLVIILAAIAIALRPRLPSKATCGHAWGTMAVYAGGIIALPIAVVPILAAVAAATS